MKSKTQSFPDLPHAVCCAALRARQKLHARVFSWMRKHHLDFEKRADCQLIIEYEIWNILHKSIGHPASYSRGERWESVTFRMWAKNLMGRREGRRDWAAHISVIITVARGYVTPVSSVPSFSEIGRRGSGEKYYESRNIILAGKKNIAMGNVRAAGCLPF